MPVWGTCDKTATTREIRFLVNKYQHSAGQHQVILKFSFFGGNGLPHVHSLSFDKGIEDFSVQMHFPSWYFSRWDFPVNGHFWFKA